MSVRDAFFSQKETLPTGKCGGRILSDMSVGCPPAVCPVVCGEIIAEDVIPFLTALGIEKLSVVR
jgi:arginine/lysine/ornithine decarboxylase